MKHLAFFVVFSGIVLFSTVRGLSGTPLAADLLSDRWKQNGPFDLSPERGRYALMYSVTEDRSFAFSLPLARFTTPDLGYVNGKYVSLFAPGVSFAVIPGYLVGKSLGIGQVGSFLTVSLFAIGNGVLIWFLSQTIGAGKTAATIAAMSFLFGTPAFTYATILYQHHISTFLMLISVLALARWRNRSFLPLFLVWFSAALSGSVDYSNFFLMLPIILVAIKKLFTIEQKQAVTSMTLHVGKILTVVTVFPPLLFFLWVNQHSYGNPLQLASTVGTVAAIDEKGRPTAPRVIGPTEDIEKYLNPETQQKSAVGFFKTRKLLTGFIVHLISLDRGIIFFAPIVLFGLVGMIDTYRRRHVVFPLIVSIIGMNVLLYSMWGDPWGGWAFGSRYLIPSYALTAVFIARTLTVCSQKKRWLIPLFFLVSSYSVAVNTLGALTSHANPPKIQILALEAQTGREEKYTVERNWDLLQANKSKSFVYQTFVRPTLSAVQYGIVLWATISISMCMLIVVQVWNKKELST